MSYRDWYCVQVASGCENKAKADLLARRAVIDDRAILDVEVPERTELTFDKKGKRKAVKVKVLPGYILVQVAKRLVEHEDGSEERVFPPRPVTPSCPRSTSWGSLVPIVRCRV